MIETSHLYELIGHGVVLQLYTSAFPHLLLSVQEHGVYILRHQYIAIAMRQQRQRYSRIKQLGIAGLLFKSPIGIDHPVMFNPPSCGAFQDQRCTDKLLTRCRRKLCFHAMCANHDSI